jgi:hypothetical protein
MGPIGCSETSVSNYHSALRKIPKELRSRFTSCGSLKSCMKYLSGYAHRVPESCQVSCLYDHRYVNLFGMYDEVDGDMKTRDGVILRYTCINVSAT